MSIFSSLALSLMFRVIVVLTVGKGTLKIQLLRVCILSLVLSLGWILVFWLYIPTKSLISYFSFYHSAWSQKIKKENFMVIDGNMLNIEPSGEIIRLEKFMNLANQFTAKNFTFHPDRKLVCLNGRNNLPCCTGNDKGNSISINLTTEAAATIRRFYRPFDNYLAAMADVELSWVRNEL